jgi:hypothetical protein
VAALLLQLHPDWQALDVKQLFGSESNHLTAQMLNAATTFAEQEEQH